MHKTYGDWRVRLEKCRDCKLDKWRMEAEDWKIDKIGYLTRVET